MAFSWSSLCFCVLAVFSGICTTADQLANDTSPLVFVAQLPALLNETSGMASSSTDTTVLVHNDSGGKPSLYEISISTGQIVRTIRVKDVKNTDWEELAEDSTHIYIGDFGNNRGARKNLEIYKVLKHDVASKDKADAEIIAFHYPEQKYFSPNKKHNFDCEAMIAVGDSLYLFTKNRGNLHTNLYRLPKTPGNYAAQHISEFHSRGLITAADYRDGTEPALVLLGYQTIGETYRSFLYQFTGFCGTDFFSGTHTRTALSRNMQAEAILFTSDSTVLITHEEEVRGLPKMYRIDLHALQPDR